MEFFVAPDGAGDGDINNPASINDALSNENIRPGSTLYLRDGVYGNGGTETFEVLLQGTEDQPIEVRPYQSERVIIDGMFKAQYCSFVHWHDLEVTNSNTERYYSGDNQLRLGAFWVTAPGCKIINCIMYNTGHPPIGPTGGDHDFEVYGCIFFYNGFYDLDWQTQFGNRGTPIYGQGSKTDGQKIVEDCISFKNWNNGMKAWGDAATVRNWTFRGNCCFNNPDMQLFVGSMQVPVENIVVEECFHYVITQLYGSFYGSTELGYRHGQTGKNVSCQKNLFWANCNTPDTGYPIIFSHWENIRFENNRVVGQNLAGCLVKYSNVARAPVLDWDRNTYHGAKFYMGDDIVSPDKSFSQWQTELGVDANSSIAFSLPSQNLVFVRPNKYKSGRANIYVANFEGLDSVSVDLSGVLEFGDLYIIRDVEDYFRVLSQGTYDGREVRIRMTSDSVASISGGHPHLDHFMVLEHTSKEFGAFVVEQVQSTGEEVDVHTEPSVIYVIPDGH